MKLRQLEFVVTIAELGSFSRAASKLRVAQPAISRQIQLLEDELGVQLFHRDGHGAIPTRAALALCKAAEDIFKQLHNVRSEIADLKDNPVGTVTLGVSPSLSQYFASYLVDDVAARFPNIVLKITEGWTGMLYDWLVSDRIDLGIIYSSQATEHLAIEPLLTEEVCLIVAHAAPVNGEECTLEQVARLPLIVPTRPHGLRLVIDKVFAKHGLAPNIAQEAEVWSVVKDSVGRGNVYGLLPPSEVRDEIASGRFRAISIADPGIKRTLCIARPRQKRVTRAVEKVFQLIIDEANNRVRDGIWTR